MPAIPPKDISQLRNESGWPCLTAFMGSVRNRSDAYRNKVRMKSLINAVDKRLAAMGMSTKARTEFLKPLGEFAQHELTIPQGGKSIALYRSPGIFKAYFLPDEHEDVWTLGETFQLGAVQPLSRDGTFYIVAISKNMAQLLRVESVSGSVEVVSVPGMPKNLKEAWDGKERIERNLQFHTLGAGGKGSMFHGGVSVKDEAKKETAVYVQKVARSVEKYLLKSKDPLVFAGVNGLFGMYRHANKYPVFFHAGVLGSPDALSAKQLAAKAKKLLE